VAQCESAVIFGSLGECLRGASSQLTFRPLGVELNKNRTSLGTIHIVVVPPSGDVAMQWTCACNDSRLLLWTHRREGGAPIELPAAAGAAYNVVPTAPRAEKGTEEEQRSEEDEDVTRAERLWYIVLKVGVATAAFCKTQTTHAERPPFPREAG